MKVRILPVLWIVLPLPLEVVISSRELHLRKKMQGIEPDEKNNHRGNELGPTN